MVLEITYPKDESVHKTSDSTSQLLSEDAHSLFQQLPSKRDDAFRRDHQLQKAHTTCLPSLTIEHNVTSTGKNADNHDLQKPSATCAGPKLDGHKHSGANGQNVEAPQQSSANGSNFETPTAPGAAGPNVEAPNGPGANGSNFEAPNVSGAAGSNVEAPNVPGATGPNAEAINANAVQQGDTIGDCYFLSALASLANTPKGPNMISQMVTDNADGSYTVTFPGAKDTPVHITDAEIKADNLQNSAPWANIVEGAFLKYQNGGALQRLEPREDGINILGNCQTASDALHLLTGESVNQDTSTAVSLGDQRLTLGSTSSDDLKQDLEAAINRGDPVTAEVGTNVPLINNTGPLVDDHVYSVLNYNAAADTVTVRNPWGDASGTPLANPGSTADGITSGNDGDLTMSFATFQSHFDAIDMAGQNDLLAHTTHLVEAQSNLLSGQGGISGVVNNLSTTGNEIDYLATDGLWDGIDAGLTEAVKLTNLNEG